MLKHCNRLRYYDSDWLIYLWIKYIRCIFWSMDDYFNQMFSLIFHSGGEIWRNNRKSASPSVGENVPSAVAAFFQQTKDHHDVILAFYLPQNSFEAVNVQAKIKTSCLTDIKCSYWYQVDLDQCRYNANGVWRCWIWWRIVYLGLNSVIFTTYSTNWWLHQGQYGNVVTWHVCELIYRLTFPDWKREINIEKRDHVRLW